jgi:glyoxylase-like metal-dependent hydrolase (beta-lactamase superfamily II)
MKVPHMNYSDSIKPFPKIDNVHPIAIPLPPDTPLLTANLYAVGSGPITLIDTGPKFPGALQFIREQMESAGFSFTDVERIIATHGHVDHTGLAAQIRAAAGHSVDICIRPEDHWLISPEHHREHMWSEEAEQLTAWAGVPEEVVKGIRRRFRFFQELCDPVDRVALLEDGDEFLASGQRLKIVHTPGHTAGSVCVYDAERKLLFSGDSIIKHITPNPLVEVKRFRAENPDYRSLPTFLNSLDTISRLDVRYAFPGHGEYVDDVNGVIATYKSHHRRRMDLVWRALEKRARPVYQLIGDVFPVVPEGDVLLAVSEIIVHLEVLVDEGRAQLVELGPPARFGAL